MLFTKETYVRFRNSGNVMAKIGGVFIQPNEDGDVPINNISTMSVSNAYRNGVVLIGMVCDGNLYPICGEACSPKSKDLAVEADPSPVAEEKSEANADIVEITSVEDEKEDEPAVEAKSAPPRRGRKPSKGNNE